jgi:environmental stress-induced protein Ves
VSDFSIIRASDHKVMRWKNGGGETAEIAISPPGAAIDSFDWRLSIAKVEADGPFSAFADIDRTLAILDGEGISLSVAGQPPVTLTPTSAPHAFAADAEASATLVRGPILDLNMMSRRGLAMHSVERMRIDGAGELVFQHSEVIVFCADGFASMTISGTSAGLARHDTLIWRGDALSMPATGTALLYVISVRRERPVRTT